MPYVRADEYFDIVLTEDVSKRTPLLFPETWSALRNSPTWFPTTNRQKPISSESTDSSKVALLPLHRAIRFFTTIPIKLLRQLNRETSVSVFVPEIQNRRIPTFLYSLIGNEK